MNSVISWLQEMFLIPSGTQTIIILSIVSGIGLRRYSLCPLRGTDRRVNDKLYSKLWPSTLRLRSRGRSGTIILPLTQEQGYWL